ncbi:hypothetical protein BNJ_00198 [Kaumoebavirus]|uniref:hypothetical protein n=1 Tax=Kaumoebavirus TaxID=1859492 RepID=UPI0009C228BB|nr:hypothetical protein BNJ_00198 [Kaumoebavirus]ARA72029.1 hypothetical protein BNJ_00198 [Kaumoebavirus]
MTLALYAENLEDIRKSISDKYGYLQFDIRVGGITISSHRQPIVHFDILTYDGVHMTVGDEWFICNTTNELISRLVTKINYHPYLVPYHNNHKLWKMEEMLKTSAREMKDLKRMIRSIHDAVVRQNPE